MRYGRLLGFVVVVAFFAALWLTGTARGAQPPLPASKHIFIISIDGLGSEAYGALKYGALQTLADQGLISEKSLAVRAADLAAGEASLLTGRNPEDHGAKNASDGQVDAESLFDVMRNHGKSLLVVDSTGGELKGFSHGSKQYLKVKEKNDLLVMKQAFDSFNREKPYLTYIYLGQPRKALERHDREAYYVALDYSQQAVGYLLHQLEAGGIAGYCTIVVTSARSSSNSNLVPIIIKSPGIQPETKIDGMKVTDLAGTICAFTNLSSVYASRGVIPWAVTKTSSASATAYYQDKQIKEMYRDRLDTSQQYYRLQDHRDSLVKELERADREKRSIFDFVGQRDQTLTQLRKRLVFTHSAFIGLIGIFGLGYYLEYRFLRKRYNLF